MGDAPQTNRSLNTIRTELEYLRDSGVLSPPQYQSISAQLPQHGGAPSQYVDPYYQSGGQMLNPSQIAQQAQDPGHPAHPQNPKHHEWAKKLATQFGNAAVFGAGATAGSDLINKIF
ncbi:hypothetical protein K490DRAFT_60017 [Saccharata proteae CBS 121410]|uniref:SH3 domain-containing protein n=1 Tax=Saccharata proteae CBS 121410 TaxID=1314787 RepID=A0A9P4HP94_9PEZI|nr:hypothetical protein K490DRAFT_60017 [Saccharata proteae CBS 121410]